MADALVFIIFIIGLIFFIFTKVFAEFSMLQGFKNIDRGNYKRAIIWFNRSIKHGDDNAVSLFGLIISHISLEEDDLAMEKLLFGNCGQFLMTIILALDRFKYNVKTKGEIYKDRFPNYNKHYFDE
jgi:hypothetical protein